MNLMEMKSQIERASSTRNLCVRFSGFEAWIDADEYCNWASMQDFLQLHCDLPEEEAFNLVNSDYIFVHADGLAGLFLKGTSFIKEDYEIASALTCSYDEDAIKAAVSLGVNLDKFEEAYRGSFGCFRNFAVEIFDEWWLQELPESVRSYIDYNAFARDLEASGDYMYDNGYVFDTCF